MLATTVPPLNVEIVKCPNKARKTAEDTVKLVQKILTQLKYTGRWLLAMNQQLTKREDFRFKVIERRGHQIVCRTKPGDNGSCWQITLSPPRGYIIDQIFSDLRLVPLSGEMLKPPSITPVNIPPLTPKEPFELPIKMDKLKPLTIPVKDKVAAPEPPVALIPALEPPIPPQNQSVSGGRMLEIENELELVAKIQSIGDNNIALTHGLVAVCLGVDKADGSILRQTAVKLLVQELNLTNFVKNNPNYTHTLKTATILISALCDKGYFGRWMAPMRKQNRMRETTKGYLLTPHGRAKLEAYRPHLSQSIQERLFQPEKVSLDDLIVPEDDDDAKIEAPAPAAPVSMADKIQKMAPLMERLKERQQSVQDCEVLIADLKKQKTTINVQPLKNRLESLQAELKTVQTELQNNQTKLDQIDTDLVAAEQLRETENQALEEISKSLQQMIVS